MKRLLLLVTLLLAVPTAALAHGDTGTLELVSDEAAGEHAVEYVVRLTYASDGDPVSGKDVTVAVDDGAPAPMTSQGDGRYAATVTLESGEHEVRFASTEPEASLAIHVVSASSEDSTTTTAEAPHVADEPLPDPDDAEGGSAWLLVLMAIIVVVMIVLAIAFVRGRRPPA